MVPGGEVGESRWPQPGSAGRVTAADSWVSPSASLTGAGRQAGRGVVVITSVVKRSQANQGIDEPSLLIFNSSQLQEVGKKEVLNDCFPTGLTCVHVQFQRADPYIMH